MANQVKCLSKTVSTLSSACINRTERIQKAADILQTNLSGITINDMKPTAITTTADKDCVDGSGEVSAITTYSLMAPDAATANSQVLSNFKVLPSTKNQTFVTAENLGGSIQYVETTIVIDSRNTYKADYYFQIPIDCKGACTTGATALQTYNLLGQTISQIKLTLIGNAN